MFVASVTIFVSAFLLFQVQPMIGKFMLPWFGGAASVWTTCMLFFQAVLLIGYWYAYWLVVTCNSKARLPFHAVLVISAALLLALGSGMQARPSSDSTPTLFILLFLASSIGLPYLCLSATAPLVQGVLGRIKDAPKIYRLYAFSNLASLVALVSYPSLFEPFLPLSQQLVIWKYAFLVYGTLILVFLFMVRKDVLEEGDWEGENIAKSKKRLEGKTQLNWFIYSALGCMVLLSATNHICQNVASIPFLWILPLGLYLLSFIIAFAKTSSYSRRLYFLLFIISCIVLFWLEQSGTPRLNYLLFTSALIVFSACMICHGELAREKPATQHLTRYYFIMSFGSVCGSLFVAIFAPSIFHYYTEYLLALLFCGWIGLNANTSISLPKASSFRIAILLFAVCFFYDRIGSEIDSERNFYGVLYVKEKNKETPDYHFYRMFHGEVVHGLQFQKPEKRRIPTTYYGRSSGIGRVLENFRAQEPRKIGGVGLGVGTIAVYGKAQDHFRFYEINPAVVSLAEEHFSYLKDSPSEISHILGDGRLKLSQETSQEFDILLLDAFSGDSVPAHLLTKEAFQEYKRHLNAHGLLVFHITNTYIDLVPIVAAAGSEIGFESYYFESEGEQLLGQVRSVYMVLGRPAQASEILQASGSGTAPRIQLSEENKQLWTDDFSNLLRAVRW